MEELTIDENLYEEVIYKINVKRLNLISSVYPIGLKFSVLAARKMERGPKMTKGGGEGGGAVERDTPLCDLGKTMVSVLHANGEPHHLPNWLCS